jgi:hypothetical protein
MAQVKISLITVEILDKLQAYLTSKTFGTPDEADLFIRHYISLNWERNDATSLMDKEKVYQDNDSQDIENLFFTTSKYFSLNRHYFDVTVTSDRIQKIEEENFNDAKKYSDILNRFSGLNEPIKITTLFHYLNDSVEKWIFTPTAEISVKPEWNFDVTFKDHSVFHHPIDFDDISSLLHDLKRSKSFDDKDPLAVVRQQREHIAKALMNFDQDRHPGSLKKLTDSLNKLQLPRFDGK